MDITVNLSFVSSAVVFFCFVVCLCLYYSERRIDPYSAGIDCSRVESDVCRRQILTKVYPRAVRIKFKDAHIEKLYVLFMLRYIIKH